MGRVTALFMMALACLWLGMISPPVYSAPQEDESQPLAIGDLEPGFDGKEVTIQFTVKELEGITQRAKIGQAPSFGIKTDRGIQKNRLDVTIDGELANVLDRLQMGAFQDNSLKAGTVIAASGSLTVHKTIPNQYLLRVSKWQGFRILPVEPDN